VPGGDRWRRLLGIGLPEAIIDALEAPLRSLDPLDSVVRRSQRSGIHLPLAFLGVVDRTRVPEIASRLRSATTGAAPFTVEVTGAGLFPSVSEAQVLWIGIGGGARPNVVGVGAR